MICILIEKCVGKKHNKFPDIFELIGKWFLFWALGVSAFTAALMQMFNPSYTANLLSVSINDFIIIKELGYANFSMGILSILSLKWKTFRQPAAISYGMFMLFCMANHLTRLGDINIDEIISTVADLWAVIIAVLVIARSRLEKYN